MPRKFIALLFMALLGGYALDAQQLVWESVLPSGVKEPTEKEKEYRNLFKDPDYSLGSANQPSPRSGFTSWQTDPNTIWIFGGMGYSESGEWGIFNDLWQYSVKENTWTLIQGEKNQAFEITENSVNPSARCFSSGWKSNDGNLWLFGGKAAGTEKHLDDLWVFDTGLSKWKQVKGKGAFNTAPVWGEKNKGSESGHPGSRSSSSTWTDRDGNLWLFGGASYETSQDGIPSYYSDLWMFDLKSMQWVWKSGEAGFNKTAFFDEPNDPKDNSGLPGARSQSATWYDSVTNELWLYGGAGVDSSGGRVVGLSDMWVYSVDKDSWRFVGGVQKGDEPGISVSPGLESVLNWPGFRISPISWKTESGELVLTGGNYMLSPRQIYVEKNVWIFSPKSGLWRAITQSETSLIGNGAAFSDDSGNSYVFGGLEFELKWMQSRPSNSIWKSAKF